MSSFEMNTEFNSRPRHITLLALMLRMTKNERTLIRQAESTDEDIADLMFLFRSSRYIDLNRQETIAGINMLEAKELLSAGRANEILTAPIQEIERA